MRMTIGALAMLRFRLLGAVGPAWLFDFQRFGDRLNAVARGLMHTPGGHLGATYWITATILPLPQVTHVYVFYLLGAAVRAGTAGLTLVQALAVLVPPAQEASDLLRPHLRTQPMLDLDHDARAFEAEPIG